MAYFCFVVDKQRISRLDTKQFKAAGIYSLQLTGWTRRLITLWVKQMAYFEIRKHPTSHFLQVEVLMNDSMYVFVYWV